VTRLLDRSQGSRQAQEYPVKKKKIPKKIPKKILINSIDEYADYRSQETSGFDVIKLYKNFEKFLYKF